MLYTADAIFPNRKKSFLFIKFNFINCLKKHFSCFKYIQDVSVPTSSELEEGTQTGSTKTCNELKPNFEVYIF